MGKSFQFGKRRRHVKSRGKHSKKTEPCIGEKPDNLLESDSERPMPTSDLKRPVLMDAVAAVEMLGDFESDNEIDMDPSELSVKPSEPQAEDSAPAVPVTKTRMERKMDLYDQECTSRDDGADRYSLVHSSFLGAVVSALACPVCSSKSLLLRETCKMGLAIHYSVFCSTCEESVFEDFTSPKVNTRRDINYRVVLGARECGIKYAQLANFFAILNLPPLVHHKTFGEISAEVHSAAKAAANEVSNQAASVVKERVKCGTYPMEPGRESTSGFPVNTVSFDGTWHKRGHSSHTGVGVAIDVETGLVLDTEVISNFCAACERGPKSSDKGYDSWKEKHVKTCQKNYDGSSNSMEAAAAERIFSRSQDSRGLIYGSMLCDGDSKAVERVRSTAGYDIEIKKEDCVNHIAKRMFNALDNLKKSNKETLNYKLTAPIIKKITNTYAGNLKKAAPDVNLMKRHVLGGIFHMGSSDKEPNHKFCPDGPTSWCKHNRAIANGQDPPPHKATFKPEILPIIYPTIKRLTEPELLQKCSKMLTQNANESFNATIWKRCPKTDFANKQNVETAVALATLAFNVGPSGIQRVMDNLGLKWSHRLRDFATAKATENVKYAKRRSTGVSKWKRKSMKLQRIEQEHSREEKEGVTYSSGAFNS